jgi:hypothetical protein
MGTVDVAPHDVFYDATRQLWYCDIEINCGASYFPFVRLALARYQPISSPNAHLSNVVLADIISLAADRWLNVTPAADSQKVRIAVFGINADESSAHHEAAHSLASSHIDPLTGIIEVRRPAAVSERNVVDVWLERLDPQLGEDFGWQRIPEAVIAQRVPVPARTTPTAPAGLESIFGRVLSAEERLPAVGAASKERLGQLEPAHVTDLIHLWRTIWEGDVMIPVAAPGVRHRLVIAEYEEYLVDDNRPYDRTPTRKGRRLVFVDHVELG